MANKQEAITILLSAILLLAFISFSQTVRFANAASRDGISQLSSSMASFSGWIQHSEKNHRSDNGNGQTNYNQNIHCGSTSGGGNANGGSGGSENGGGGSTYCYNIISSP